MAPFHQQKLYIAIFLGQYKQEGTNRSKDTRASSEKAVLSTVLLADELMKLGWLGLFFCAGLSVGLSAAPTPTRAELVVDTQQITLSAKQNQSIRKSLRLTSTEDTQQPLQITPSDLELAEGRDRIPAQAITITPSSLSLNANQAEIIELQLEESALVTSGEFTGSLLLQYEDSSRTLPMTVRVKAPALLPLLTLLAGAGLGTLLGLYRSVGLPKDELLVKTGKLKTQMRAEDDTEAVRFKTKVEGELIALEIALGNRDWQSAEMHLQSAQTTWTRWLSAKSDWIVQISYLQELVKKVNNQANAYQQLLGAELKAVERQIAEQASPQALATLIVPIREQLARYQRGDRWLQKISNLSAKIVDSAQSNKWETQRARLEDELGALDPKQVDEFNTWLARVKETEKSMAQVVAEQATGATRRGSNSTPVENLLRPAPAVSAQGKQLPSGHAQKNLRLFRWVSQAAAITLITWLGMVELYEREAAFGKTPIGDYFGLFAWGFGAEVSRDAIVKALGDLKSPLGIKKKENS